MPKLSQSQIAMYAQSAGLSADRAKIAAAIAMAESGGRTEAHNAVPPDDSYGLWQINMLGSMGPSRRRQFGLSSNAQLYDPATNARAMAAISSKGSNFGPWSTYTSGAYKKHLGGAAGASWSDPFGTNPFDDDEGPNLFAPPTVPGLESLSGLSSMAELGIGAAEWIANPHNWVRVLQVAAGALMVGVGLAVMTRGAWQPAADAAKKVAAVVPAGKAATAATKTATKTAPKAAPKVKAAAA